MQRQTRQLVRLYRILVARQNDRLVSNSIDHIDDGGDFVQVTIVLPKLHLDCQITAYHWRTSIEVSSSQSEQEYEAEEGWRG